MRRFGALAALFGIALALLAACGGDGGATSEGVERIPADARFVAVVDTDFESSQWEQANALIERFPGGRDGIAGLFRMQDDVDFERDVEPALGPETVLASLDAHGDGVVVLTEPDDASRFEALVARGDMPAVTRDLGDGWWAAAATEEELDRLATDGGDSLAGTDAWEEATEGLPEDALVTVYGSAGPLDEGLRGVEVPPEVLDAVRCVLAGEEAPPSGFAVTAAEEGLRIEGSGAFPEGLPQPDEEASELAGVLPAEALVFVSGRALGEYLREGLRCAADESEDVATQLAQIELGLGLSLEEDVLPLLARETAFAVYEHAGGPALVAATQVEDETRALAVVDRILERSRLLDARISVEEETIGGIGIRRVSLGGAPVLAYAAVDGILGFSNVDGGLLALRGQDPPLAEDEEYRAAREAAGAPDENAGFLYADAQRVATLLSGMLAPGAVDLSPNLEPLRSILLWGTVDDDRAIVEGLVRID